MFIYILFLIGYIQESSCYINNSPSVYYVRGLKINFLRIREGTACDSTDNSCYVTLCGLLSEKNSSIAYVVFTPMDPSKMNCKVIETHIKANMIVFGTDLNDRIIFAIVCTNIGECIKTGCQMYNSNINLGQILFTGQCIV